MEIVIHRVNTIAALERIPTNFGAEIDIRVEGRELILNHEPYQPGERLVDYLAHYHHGLLVLNVKSAGIEDDVLKLIRARGLERCFLLDVEFPYISRATRRGERAIALRYSEDEDIATVVKFRGLADWVWIDTRTVLPLSAAIIDELRGFKTCLVCPERWGRPADIPKYRRFMGDLGFAPDAVMTAAGLAPEWAAPW